jgi:hypothetical protein
MTGNDSRLPAGLVINTGLFLVLLFLLLSGRDSFLLFPAAPSAEAPYDELNDFCDYIPACLRIASAWSWKLLADPAKALTVWLYSYEVYGVTGYPAEIHAANADRMAAVLHRLLVLLPLLLVVHRITVRPAATSVLILLAFAAMLGWSPALYLPMIEFYSLFADWPRYYWDYTLPLQFYDYISIGFLFFLLWRLSRAAMPGYRECILLVVGGQLLFENLGMLTGVAIFLRCLALPEGESRIAPAFKRLVVSGVASVIAMAVMLTLIQLNMGQSASSHGDTLGSYFESYSALVANNIQALPIIIANFINLLTLPVVIGGLGGLLLARLEGAGHGQGAAKRLAVAAVAISAGFASTLCIGFFVNSFLSETGRQILPLITMTTMASCLTVRWLVVRKQGGEAAA